MAQGALPEDDVLARQQPPPAAPLGQPDPGDPFQGGGVKINGGWVPKNHPLAQQAGGGPAAPGSPGPMGAAPRSTDQVLNQAPSDQPPKTAAEAFQKALVGRLTAGPVTAQDPSISGVIGANRGAEQRAFERNRAMLAERAASQGLDPNAMTSQLTGLAESRAGREGAFEGQAVMQGQQQRAQEISQALQLGGSMLSDNDRMALQRELAQLQASISREGMALQGSLGQGDLALRRSLGEGQLNLGLLNSLLGNDQFSRGLNLDAGKFQAGMNQNALLQALGLL